MCLQLSSSTGIQCKNRTLFSIIIQKCDIKKYTLIGVFASVRYTAARILVPNPGTPQAFAPIIRTTILLKTKFCDHIPSKMEDRGSGGITWTALTGHTIAHKTHPRQLAGWRHPQQSTAGIVRGSETLHRIVHIISQRGTSLFQWDMVLNIEQRRLYFPHECPGTHRKRVDLRLWPPAQV